MIANKRKYLLCILPSPSDEKWLKGNILHVPVVVVESYLGGNGFGFLGLGPAKCHKAC